MVDAQEDKQAESNPEEKAVESGVGDESKKVNPQESDDSMEPETDKIEQDDTTEKVERENYKSSGRDRYERKHSEMSFEEKLRAFKKQSEERLLHIKRSREAKIGKKKTR